MQMNMDMSKTDLKALNKLQAQCPAAFNKSLKKAAIQLLTWMNTGSPNEDRTPPVRWGVLRGSSSAFVGAALVGVGKEMIKSGSPEKADPVRAYDGNDKTVTIIYNTDYAKKMHEWGGGWGPYTSQAGNAGNKWIEKHLIADKDIFMKFIRDQFQKEAKL